MKSGYMPLFAFLLCTLVLMTSLFIPGFAQSTNVLYDDSFDTVCKLGESNSCYSTQGFAAGKEVGRLVYRMDGKVIGTVSLKTESGVEKSKLHRTFFQRIQDIFIK